MTWKLLNFPSSSERPTCICSFFLYNVAHKIKTIFFCDMKASGEFVYLVGCVSLGYLFPNISNKNGAFKMLGNTIPVTQCHIPEHPNPQLYTFNPLNTELNPICYLVALLAHHFLHVSRIMVKSLTVRLLKSYIYGAPILDVSRSHTTHHSR